MGVVFSDRLGHHQQGWLCCEHLPQDERLGRRLGKRGLPCLQLLSKVSTSCRRGLGWDVFASCGGPN